MKTKKGFTLTEILIAAVIVAILGGVAIPQVSKAKARASAAQAVAYLRNIKTSEKMYYAKWKNYVGVANAAAVKAALGVDAQSKDYNFSIVASTATNTFTATAAKKTGVAADKITLDQDGTFTAGGTESTYKPAN